MTALLLMSGVVILVLIGLLVLMGKRIEGMGTALMEAEVDRSNTRREGDLDLLWAKVRAQVLRDAAEAWPKVDAESERKRLSWKPVPEGEPTSLVVRWLIQRADDTERMALPNGWRAADDVAALVNATTPKTPCPKCRVSRNAGGGPCPLHR